MIPFHFEDRPVGTLWVVSLGENGRRFDAEDLRLLTSLARFASIAYRLTLTQDRVSQYRLEAELADSRLLQAISSELITENDEKGFRERLLDAAMSIMHSDCASLQMFKEDANGGHLELIASRGFSQEAIDRWKTVDDTRLTVCGEMLRSGRRVIVPDVTKCAFMDGSDDLAFLLGGGIRAVPEHAAAVPQRTSDGRVLDALADCPCSQRPRLAAPRHSRVARRPISSSACLPKSACARATAARKSSSRRWRTSSGIRSRPFSTRCNTSSSRHRSLRRCSGRAK